MLDWFKGKDVALVGSAGALFDQKYGAQIDQHEVVVRINRGVIIKDKDAQGTKTDYWAVGKPKTVQDLIDTHTYKGNIHLSVGDRGKKHPKIDYYIPMKTLNSLIGELGHKKPSSGLMILYHIYMSNPKSLSLYGFDWNKSGTWYHIPWSAPHDWGREERFIRKKYLSQENVHYFDLPKTDKKLKFKDTILKEDWFTPEQQKTVDKKRSTYLKQHIDKLFWKDNGN